MFGYLSLEIAYLGVPSTECISSRIQKKFSKGTDVIGSQLATFIAGNYLKNCWIRRNTVVINSKKFLQKALGFLNRNSGTL